MNIELGSKKPANAWVSSYLSCLPIPPKPNGRVERAHRTHLEEFYAVIPDSPQLDKLNIALYKWELVYNQIRSLQALDYLTPAEYIRKYHPNVTSIKSHMY